MKKSYRFELCAETLEAAIAAQAGGADRMELCTDLRNGGVTPGAELLAATLANVVIPVHVLIRPRAGDFVYSATEFGQMMREIDEARAAGAAGIAVGILLPSGRIDMARTRELMERARPMHLTFHRAFDEITGYRDVCDALEDVLETGADTLLTSGCAPNVLEGASSIRRLVLHAGNRIEIMAGGGLKLANLVEVASRTGATTLHGSLTRAVAPVEKERQAALIADIREALRLMDSIFEQESLKAVG